MPQHTEEEREKRARELLGITDEATPPPGVKPVSGYAKVFLETSPFLNPRKTLAVGATGLSGALGGARYGGLLGTALGAAGGALGGIIDPESAFEQSVGNLAGGPFGGGKLALLRRIMQPAAAFGAARGARGAIEGESLAEAGTGALASTASFGALNALGPLLSFARTARKGGALKGGAELTQNLFRGLKEAFGDSDVTPIIKKLNEKASTGREFIPNLKRMSGIRKEPLLALAVNNPNPNTFATRVFQNPEAIKAATKQLDPEELRTLFADYVGREFVARTVPVKTGILGPGRAILAEAEQMANYIRHWRESGAPYSYQALPKDLKEGMDTFEHILRKLDPSEASMFAQTIQQAIGKQVTYTMMRAGAGMHGAGGGLAGAFGANFLRKLTNPEYRALVKLAEKGDREAIEAVARSLSGGISGALFSPPGQEGFGM